MTTIFDPIKLGADTAANRAIMAPLTRGRATRDHVPTPIMVDLYDPGLVKFALNGSFC